MDLPDKLKIARQAIGKNQKEMADMVGCSYRSWQVYEQGTSVPGGNILKALAELGFNVNWFFDDGDTAMFTEPRNRAAHVDMVKEVALGDKEAAARRTERMVSITSVAQKAKEEVQSYRNEIKEAPAETQIEALCGKLEAETFSRIAAQDKLNAVAVQDEAQHQHQTPVGFDDLGMAEGMGLLARIYSSGDVTYIRAINANLMAFGGAIDNKVTALNTLQRMEQMEERMNKERTAFEQRLQSLEQRLAERDTEEPGQKKSAAA